MRVGYLTAEYAYGNRHRGGLGNYLRRLTLALAERGHEPHVFYYIDEPSCIHIDHGIHIHFINSRRSKRIAKINSVTRNKLRQTLDGLERSCRFRRYLREAVLSYSLDILQVPSANWPGLLVSNDIPMVTRSSGHQLLWDRFEGLSLTLDRRLYGHLELLQYRRAAGIFAPSKLLAATLEKSEGVPEVAVIRTPFFIEVDELDGTVYADSLQGEDYILFFGKLSPLKGPQVIADALPLVWKRYPDLVAVFVGEDRAFDNKTRMVEYIRKKCRGFEHKIRFFPLLPHDQLYAIVQNARLVVLPSLFDNSPNTMLEAMGFGKPVVGTYGSSMDEFIDDGISGFLVRRGDSQELAEKICEAWNHPELESIGAAAKAVVLQYRPDNVIPQLLDFYERYF